MAGKSGRLTFSGRQEYVATPYYMHGGICYGYAVICRCIAGNHFLSPSGEHTVSNSTPVYVYPTISDAQAAIEAWQAQHQADAAHRGESEAE